MSRTKVHVALTNRFAFLIRPFPYDDLIKYWSYSVPNFQFMKGRFPHWDGRVKMLKRDKMSAGLFRATYKEIEQKENIKFEIHKRREWVEIRKHGTLKSTGEYEFQNDCADKMVESISKGGGLILNATGSGKTRIAAMFASRVKSDICFVVDQLVLLDQARDDMQKHLGEKIGYVGDSKFRLRRVTIATIQTLHTHRFTPEFRDWAQVVDFVMIDEIHDQMNRRNFDVTNSFNPLAVFGLTATLALTKKPVRMKAWSLAGPVLYEYPLLKGMTEGVLARGYALLCTFNNDVRELDAYDARTVYEKRLVENAERNHMICSLVKEANRRKKYVIVLAERIAHLEELSKRLRANGLKHRVVAGKFKQGAITKDSRIRSKKRFESGDTRILLASKVFTKGVDIKRVDVIIDAAGLKSKNNAIQKFGRGIRKHDDKAGLIYIDIQDVDRYDKGRKDKNWLAQAAKSRKRALKKAGITMKEFTWRDHAARELFHKAEHWLGKEINTNGKDRD